MGIFININRIIRVFGVIKNKLGNCLTLNEVFMLVGLGGQDIFLNTVSKRGWTGWLRRGCWLSSGSLGSKFCINLFKFIHNFYF